MESVKIFHFNVFVYDFSGDNGTMHFWDWKTGYNFQRSQASVQPGSLDSEAGIFAMTFDLSSSRLITCEADKTIKIYKEDDTAVSFILFPMSNCYYLLVEYAVAYLNFFSNN